MKLDREVKNLKRGEVIHGGRVVGDCEQVCDLWLDTRYFELDEPGLIVAWLPKVGVIDVFSEVDPPSSSSGLLYAMRYSDLDLWVSFDDLAKMNDDEVLALVRERRMSVEDYYKAWGY